MMFRRRWAALLVLFCCLILSGCWDRREIENLGFVLMAGLDQMPNDRIMITVQVAKPFAIASGGSRPIVDERPFCLASSTGRTVFEAVRGFLSTSARRLFWAHTRFVIISEDLARKGIQGPLDWFTRYGEARMRQTILVARGHRAADILQAQFELQRLPMEGIEGIMMDLESQSATTVVSRLLFFNRALKDEGIEPVAACVELVERPPHQDIRGHLKNEVISASASIKGAAVFRGDRMVGWLSERETRGLNWVLGHVRNTVVVVTNPLNRNTRERASIEILRSNSKVVPSFHGGLPAIEIKIEAQGNLSEVQGYLNPLDPSQWKALEESTANVIRREIQDSITRAKGFNSDVFGFGRAFYSRYPREWYGGLKSRWYNIFPELKVHTKVKVRLQKTGLFL